MCRAIFLTRSTGQEIHRPLSNIAADSGDIRLYTDQINFRQLVISAISMISNSILSLSTFNRKSAALYAVSNISG